MNPGLVHYTTSLAFNFFFYFEGLTELPRCSGWAQTCDPPALASQSARVIDLHHCAELASILKCWGLMIKNRCSWTHTIWRLSPSVTFFAPSPCSGDLVPAPGFPSLTSCFLSPLSFWSLLALPCLLLVLRAQIFRFSSYCHLPDSKCFPV